MKHSHKMISMKKLLPVAFLLTAAPFAGAFNIILDYSLDAANGNFFGTTPAKVLRGGLERASSRTPSRRVRDVLDEGLPRGLME